MPDLSADITISGGGIAGLTAAVAFAHLGHSVTIADPTPAPAHQIKDLRSTAFLHPAKTLFQDIGLWPILDSHTTPLNALRIVDTTGWPPTVTETRQFEPTDLNTTSFGWNLPNHLIRATLLDQIKATPNITHINAGFQSVLTRTSEAFVTLTNGQRIRTQLLIGADGRNSATRQAADITIQTYRYGQKALAFCASHSKAHHNVSTEIYNQGGAFTTVPLPDHNGHPTSAIVWMNDGPKTQTLASLSDPDFNREMTTRACALLGEMTKITDLATWPVITQRATKLTAERIALIAEAAHVLPPIGAQGLNTSLHDIAALYDILKSQTHPLGSPDQLAQYEQARHRDIARRATAIDAFNRICKSGIPAIQALRRTGLMALHDIAPIRQSLMKAGLGRR